MAGGILDPKSIQERLETLVNQQVDQKVEGKEPPASSAAPADPFEGMQNPAAPATPPAAAAPSAPAAGGTTPVEIIRTGYKAYYEFEYLGLPDEGDDTNLMSEPMNFTAGQGAAPAHASPTDDRTNIEKIIDGDRTASSRRYLPQFKAGDSVVLTYNGQPAAVVRIKAVYNIIGKSGEEAVLTDASSGAEVRRPISELAASEGYDYASYAKKLYGTTPAVQRAESPEIRKTVVGTPPPGETTPSVAPTGLPEAPTAPVEGPQTQTTATTPPDPFSGITDPALLAGGVPEEDMVDQPVYELPKTGGRRIAVIGTAGRKDKQARLTAADFDAMVAHIVKLVQPNDTLVSGGAAWADHAAVRAFLEGKVAGLVLHLPAELMDADETPDITAPEGGRVRRMKFDNAGFGTVGAAANYYHRLFAEKLGLDPDATIREIQAAIDKGAVVTYGDGTSSTSGDDSSFKLRNTLIANDADYGLIAFDFDVDDRSRPADGGTGDTWRKHSKTHRASKRMLVDIRAIRPDPEELDRITGFNKDLTAKIDRAEEVKRLMATIRASDMAAEERIPLLSKLTTLGKGKVPSDRDIDDVISVLESRRKRTVLSASSRAYLPIQKLVSAAIMVALADAGRLPERLSSMLDKGEIPNLGYEMEGLDPDAALIFLRTRALQHSIERGTGDNAREADRILHKVLLSLGIPEESLQPRTPYRPNFSTMNDDEATVEKVERSTNQELANRLERIKSVSAKLGALISHPEVAKPLYTITELLRGVEADIQSEPKTLQISRLRTAGPDRMPYLKAVGELDPVFDYIKSPEYLIQGIEVTPDPYATALAVIESRAIPPETHGEGAFAYDEAQLKGTYDSRFASSPGWRRYALDIDGVIDDFHLDLDEFGLVADKFDGFQNPYASYAAPDVTYGVSVARAGFSGRSKYNRSRATIGMHVSADASAGILWQDRAVSLEVHVVRAIKKLLADTQGTDLLPDTPDELAIIRSGFIPYTRDAAVVSSSAKNITTSLNATLGKIVLVDTGEMPQDSEFVFRDPSGSYVKVDGEKFYVGKGFYAFKESDPRGIKLEAELRRISGSATRITAPFNIGELDVQYPESVPPNARGDALRFALTVDPVVHQTFQHTPEGRPLVRADGRPFQGTYIVYSTEIGDDGAKPSHDYDDSNLDMIDFDEGMRFGIAVEVPAGLSVDGVNLERDYYGDDEYARMQDERKMQLGYEGSKAADRQAKIEAGETVLAPDQRALEYEAAASGETYSHFGQTYGFDELDTSKSEEAAHPLRKLMSRMQARDKERMARLGVSGEVNRPASVQPQFDVEAFLQAESLSPENAALAKQLLLDYMWILRLRVRDASQSTPRPTSTRDSKTTFLVHRGVAMRRTSIIESLSGYDILALHNAATKGPATLNAVIAELMDATGDDPTAVEEVLSETYKLYPEDDPRKLTSTREGKMSYDLMPPRNDLEKYANILADEIRRSMVAERGGDPGKLLSIEALISGQIGATDAEESLDTNLQGSAEPGSFADESAELVSLDQNSPEFAQKLAELQAKVVSDQAFKPVRYTTKSGVKLVAITAESEEILQDIIARDEAGRLTDQVLVNATANMQRANRAAAKESAPPAVKSEPSIRDRKLLAFLQTADRNTLRNLLERAWAKYAEHMAADGDYDSFVNVIRNGLRSKKQLPQALNFVLDKVGAVRIPDAWFMSPDGAVSLPVPKVKNPKYSSRARRVDAMEGVLSTSDMKAFVANAQQSGALSPESAVRLLGVIRFAEQVNKVSIGKGDKNRTLGFYIMSDDDGRGRVVLTTSPTYASQKVAEAPYSSTEKTDVTGTGPQDWATLEDTSGRLQTFNAQELQKIIEAAGAQDLIRVVPLPVAEDGILSQAQGVATEAELSKAMPYAIQFADGTSVDSIVGLFNKDSLNLQGGRTESEAIVYRVLDSAIRARFFALFKGILDSSGVTEQVVESEELDSSPFEERVVQPTEDVVARRILAGQTEAEARKPKVEYVVKASIEGRQSYEGPFSRSQQGASATLDVRPYKTTYMTPALKAVREKVRLGLMTLTQDDADDLGDAIDRTIEYKKAQMAHAESSKTAVKPRGWSPGAKAGVIGGSAAGTLAAFLQFGADEQAKEIALASLPGQVAFEALGAVPKVGGPVAAATGLGLTYATGGDMLRALIGIAGSVAGGAIGTGLGLFTGPGAFAAGLAGSTAGYMAADSIYSAVTGKSNTSPMPQNLASSNPMMSAQGDVPSNQEIQRSAPVPAVNKDFAQLEEMENV